MSLYGLSSRNKHSEKCPIGYHNINCSEKCKYPSFGEDCQGECKCRERLCDFVRGCLEQRSKDTRLFVIYRLHTTRYFGTTPVSDITVSTEELTPQTTKMISTIKAHQTKVDFILYGIFILVGVFLMLFGVFVATYLYKQCFRKRTTSKRYGTVELTAVDRYKGLENQKIVTNDSSENTSPDPVYLDPICVDNESPFNNVESDQLSLHIASVYLEVVNCTSSEESLPSSEQNFHNDYVEVIQ
ncbi:uncharacterized protein LOC133200403 [Saccostrea echinata]|uniref:uncharacterized protein LOC133200403 n=1 Tax=Saccostrea echinata TaxID=191078 RepID=UPI002A81E763|nr:uncharacterized protein LOC133200403 [Saccostrea echinata]